MPKVYIVHEPLKRDAQGQWVPFMNFTPARKFGDLIFLLPPGRPPSDPDAALEQMHEKLADITEDDYFLPVGNMVMVTFAAAIIADITGGLMNILDWDNRGMCYHSVKSKIWRTEDAEEHV